jgi:hypothetical protein
MADDLASVVDAVQHAARVGRLTPEQVDAFQWLQANLTDQQRRAFTTRWRAAAPSPPPAPPAPEGRILLPVPYLSQRDSATTQGDRMCFSSTCAMAVRFLKPGALPFGIQPDDVYLNWLRAYGDTTDAAAHVELLQSLGIPARFGTDGTLALLQAELRAGRPVAVGWLHKGPVSDPSGGGHWSLVVGWEPGPNGGTLIMHDPFGEAALASGGYEVLNSAANAHQAGRAQRYSWAGWSPRWMVDGPGSGWFIAFS